MVITQLSICCGKTINVKSIFFAQTEQQQAIKSMPLVGKNVNDALIESITGSRAKLVIILVK